MYHSSWLEHYTRLIDTQSHDFHPYIIITTNNNNNNNHHWHHWWYWHGLFIDSAHYYLFSCWKILLNPPSETHKPCPCSVIVSSQDSEQTFSLLSRSDLLISHFLLRHDTWHCPLRSKKAFYWITSRLWCQNIKGLSFNNCEWDRQSACSRRQTNPTFAFWLRRPSFKVKLSHMQEPRKICWQYFKHSELCYPHKLFYGCALLLLISLSPVTLLAFCI